MSVTVRVIVFCLLLSVCLAKAKITKVTTKNWSTILDENDNVLVLFGDMRPGACYQSEDALEVFETFFSNSTYKQTVKAVQVDCDRLKDLCEKYKIKTVPKVKLFSEGLAVYDYELNKVLPKAIENFLDTYVVPKYSQMSSASEIRNFVQENKLAVVGLFADDQNESFLSFARAAAECLHDIPFIWVKIDETTQNLKNELNISSSVAIVSHINKQWKSLNYEANDFSRKRLLIWVKENLPARMEELAEKSKLITGRGLPMLSLFVDYNDESEIQRLLGIFEEFIEEFKGRFSFVYQDSNDHPRTMTRYGIRKAPFVLLHSIETRVNFVFPVNKEITADNLRQFCRDYLEKNLAMHVVKESLPDNLPADQLVKHLVHDNYQQTLTESVAIVIFYHINWDHCEPCAELMKEFEIVAETLKPITKLTFAKFNVEMNPEIIRIANFPSVHLYTGSKKMSVSFDGIRSAEGLKSWILAHLPNSLVVGTPFQEGSSEQQVKSNSVDGSADVL